MSDLYDRLRSLPPDRLALLALEQQERLAELEGGPTRDPIAVVGLSCRLPGAPDPEAYWELLSGGGDAIREITPDRWDVDAYYDPDPDVPGRIATRWAGLLDEIDRFDPQFFGISPREAGSMDPQQRLLLEVSWEALERSGIPPHSLFGTKTGTYVGMCNTDYLHLLYAQDEREYDMYLSTGNAGSVASGRLAYVLGLQGPAVSVDTACSSSLVATHLAVQGLRAGDCDVALAAGVNVILSAKTTMTLSQAKMMASDGRCKPFDASADGFVRGEGCGVLVLKRLADAERDGDTIHAVIRGSAVNQDGRSNGLTAPNGPSQVSVIRAALADAGMDPATIGYVEAHGTGTSLGDPIEAQALGTALGPGRGDADRLLVGSVKSNIGHLESAAGVAGLIKLVLSMQHGEIPPSLHMHEPSPHIPWDRLPIDVVTGRRAWPGRAAAGVSSFGFSGTNAHIIVEPAPAADNTAGPARSQHLLVASATDPESLAALAERYEHTLTAGTLALSDLAAVAATGRSHHPHRLAVVATDVAEAVSGLRAAIDGDPDAVIGRTPARAPRVAFLFTGHGSQYAGMGTGLYRDQPAFRAAFDECVELLQANEGIDLLAAIDADSDALERMALAQPAVFAVEYAAAAMWRSWGVVPDVVLGHSVGEYVAAVEAGVMSLADGLTLVAARGRLMDSLPGDGAMATVLASESEVLPLLHGASDVSVAAVNGPRSVAIAGPRTALDAVIDTATAAGFDVRPLDVPVAAHSAHIDPILDEFERVAATVAYREPTVPVISGLTGDLADPAALCSAAYWRRHLRQPVRFADAFGRAVAEGATAFVELGPHPTLINMGRHIVDDDSGFRWLSTLRRDHAELATALRSLGHAYVAGLEIEWEAVSGAPTAAAEAPTYPFRRDRFWTTGSAENARPTRDPLLPRLLQSPALDVPVHETELATDWPTWLDDHRIHGTALAPAPLLLTLAMAGAEPGASLADISIAEPLVLPDDASVPVQVIARPEGDGTTVAVVGRATPQAEWATHLTARRSADAAPRPDGGLPSTADLTEMDGTALYATLDAIGVGFGPALRGIDTVWCGEHDAVARIVAPDAVRKSSHDSFVHPALVDACFHALGAPDAVRERGEAALLVGIDHLRFHSVANDELWCSVRLRPTPADDPTIVGDVSVVDNTGRPVLDATGVQLRMADQAAIRRAAGRQLDDAIYDVSWVDVGGSARAGDPSALLDALAASIGERRHDVGADAHAEFLVGLDRLAAAHATVALADSRGVVDAHCAVAGRLRKLLGDRGAEDPGALAGDLRATHPGRSAEIDLVDRCGAALADVFAGLAEPLDLLFPAGDQSLTEHLYRNTPTARVANGLVADAAAALADAVPGRPLRVLEVGAGTGATTDAVLEALADEPIAYTATDIAPTFVSRLTERFARRDDVDATVFDVERDAAEQGLDLGAYDLVVAANVVHATADVEQTLAALGTLLRPGGRLVLLENTTERTWVTTTFGLTEGWWRFSDHERRTEQPLLSVGGWIDALADAGFADARSLSGGDDINGQAIITARRPESERDTLVVGPPGQWRDRFAAALEADGTVRIADPGDATLVVEADPSTRIVVVHGADPAATLARDGEAVSTQAHDATRTLLAAVRSGARVWNVTRGAQAVDGPPSAPHLAATWGLGRGASLEHPDRWGASIDLDPASTEIDAEIDAVRRLLDVPHADDQLALRADRVLAPRLGSSVLSPADAPIVHADATYLVTGGLGGLGRVVASWLADNGADTILLVGRSGLPSEPDDAEQRERVAAVERLRSRGLTVEVVAADVADRAAMADVINRCGSDLPPLRGIVHAAAALGDAAIDDLDPATVDTMLAPKVAGTWVLDELTTDLALDFAVSFSSTTALWGSSGLAHYAAANAVLDAHAHARRDVGRPWTSINWGTWEVMRVASAEDRENVERGGLKPIPVDEALEAMSRAIAAEVAQVAVVRADFTTLRALYETRRPRPFFGTLGMDDAPARPRTADTAGVAAALDAAEPDERPSILESFLLAEVARSLQIADPTKVDPDQGLFEMGMDSLMSVELKGRIEHGLGLSLPSTLTFNYPTVTELTAHLLTRTGPGPATDAAQPAQTTVATPAAPRPEIADDLDEDELEALLAERLAGLRNDSDDTA